MLIEPKTNEELTEKTNRKQGGAFDTLAKIFKGIKKMVFSTGTVIEDRPGVLTEAEISGLGSTFVKSKSVFEIYKQNKANVGEHNLMFFGRKGTNQYRNTNYIEITADAKSTINNTANGKIILVLSRDGVQRQRSGISLVDVLSDNPGVVGNDGVVALINGEGADGGVGISYYANGTDENPLYNISVDKNGITMYGLPTTNPGIGGKIWNNGGTLKITSLT